MDAHADQASVLGLDLSFRAHRVFVVHRRPTGFDLVEEASSPPIEGRYQLEWTELVTSAHAVVAEQAGRVVGIAALTVSDWNQRGTVAHLYVDRAWRGMGIGTQLVPALEQEGARCGVHALWVETQNVNVAAFRFYESCGFALCGLDMVFYDPAVAPNETAVFLAKALVPPRAAPVSGDAAAV